MHGQKNIKIFWDVTPRSLLHKYKNFGGNFFLNVQDIRCRKEVPSRYRYLLIHHAGYEDRKLRIYLRILNLTR